MAQRTKVKVVASKSADPISDGLAAYGLTKGDYVRYRTPLNPTGDWSYGTVSRVNKDGSIDIYDERTRSIMPEYIQVKGSGPKGGTIWHTLAATVKTS